MENYRSLIRFLIHIKDEDFPIRQEMDRFEQVLYTLIINHCFDINKNNLNGSEHSIGISASETRSCGDIPQPQLLLTDS